MMIDVINILEGGIEAIEDKFKTYSNLAKIFPQLIMSDIIRRFNFEQYARIREHTFTLNNISKIVSVMDFSEILKHEFVDKPQFLDNVDSIEKQNPYIKQLEELINSINKLNKLIDDLETLHYEPSRQSLNLYELLANLKSSNVKWQNYILLSEPIREINIFIDKTYAEFIFKNIFRNSTRAISEKNRAINRKNKANRNRNLKKGSSTQNIEGTIEVSVLDESNSNSVTICIQDNGIGVEEEIKYKLFKEDSLIIKQENGRKRETKGHQMIYYMLKVNQATIELDLEKTVYSPEFGKTVLYVTIQKSNH
jgi:signal transduction histidine kinase